MLEAVGGRQVVVVGLLELMQAVYEAVGGRRAAHQAAAVGQLGAGDEVEKVGLGEVLVAQGLGDIHSHD